MNGISLNRGFCWNVWLRFLVGVGLDKSENEMVMLKCLVGDLKGGNNEEILFEIFSYILQKYHLLKKIGGKIL